MQSFSGLATVITMALAVGEFKILYISEKLVHINNIYICMASNNMLLTVGYRNAALHIHFLTDTTNPLNRRRQ